MTQLIRNLPFDDYLKIDAVSNSGLGLIEKSPAHFRAGFQEKSASLDLGSLTHTLILEPNEFSDRYIVADLDRRTKAGKEKAAELAETGKEVISPALYDTASRMRDSVMNHTVARDLFSQGEPEVSMVGEIDEVAVKGRIDWLRGDGLIVDLKTTALASIEGFTSSVWKYGYCRQNSLYTDLLSQERPVTDFWFVCVESAPPYAVAVHSLSESFINLGRAKYRKALAIYKECKASDCWPGYSDEVSVLEPKPWMLYE